jgi:hypothetical protein
MKYFKLLVSVCLLTALTFGCQGSGGQQTIADSLSTAPAETEDTLSVVEDQVQNESVQNHLSQLKEEWSAVSNSVQATYQGAEFGDYFHITFETSDGKLLDFGDGDNELGTLELYNVDFENNQELLGKQFKITWAWKESSFNCCEGAMESVTAQVPSITSIELIK